MRAPLISIKVTGVVAMVLAVVTGCESTGGGDASTSTSVYYGVGFYDPWYYGHWDDPGYIVTPPPAGGGGVPIAPPPRPEHPIARPLPTPAPRPTPMPSVPSAPRPMARPAMRR